MEADILRSLIEISISICSPIEHSILYVGVGLVTLAKFERNDLDISNTEGNVKLLNISFRL